MAIEDSGRKVDMSKDPYEGKSFSVEDAAGYPGDSESDFGSDSGRESDNELTQRAKKVKMVSSCLSPQSKGLRQPPSNHLDLPSLSYHVLQKSIFS
jgi:hypothetical protein